MAGTDSRFNATEFREAIKFAMVMGAPEEEEKRVTFKWKVVKTFSNVDGDSAGNPWSWTATETATSAPADVQVDCAVVFAGGNTGSTVNPEAGTIGQFEEIHGVITLLDVDYEEIFQDGRRADQVEIDDAIYDIKYVGPPVGLFDVTVYSVYIQAVDES